jgi:hypothetical protein
MVKKNDKPEGEAATPDQSPQHRIHASPCVMNPATARLTAEPRLKD